MAADRASAFFFVGSSKVQNSVKLTLKLGFTILFINLKIILLQYFQF